MLDCFRLVTILWAIWRKIIVFLCFLDGSHAIYP
jgi:hypothetical protein